ncbi:MAG: hypothetical protein PWP27_1168, partial [Clostridiales bacterium]|jgi:hypothetical protein|nr:hypothetical protein [Clostridiales bacterium]MDK2933358.1 hypothetical protein [Clostridiales bacterium]
MCDNDIYFITRLKKNAAMTILEEYKLPKGDHNSMSDCKVITGQENGNTKMTNPLRLIIAASDEKNIYVFLPIGLI